LLGAVITAALMIASSLPQTQSMVARYFFSNPFLLPSSDNIVEKYGYAGIAMRGQSLVGISILSGAFLNPIWPLIFLLRTNKRLGAQWSIIMIAAIILIPIGVVMSYSRGMIVGLVLIVIVVLLLSSGKIRQPIVLGVGIAILIFSWVGWGSEYFKFEWLQDKTEYQFAHVYQSDDMTQRIYAYSDPFQLISENPAFIFLGEGLARKKVDGASSATSGFEMHTVFASATYGYGMLSAIAYVLLLLRSMHITWTQAWGSKDNFSTMFSRAMLASLFGFSSWFLLGHAAVTEPRGAMLLFFVFGLVATQANFATSPEPVRQELGITFRRHLGNGPGLPIHRVDKP